LRIIIHEIQISAIELFYKVDSVHAGKPGQGNPVPALLTQRRLLVQGRTAIEKASPSMSLLKTASVGRFASAGADPLSGIFKKFPVRLFPLGRGEYSVDVSACPLEFAEAAWPAAFIRAA
jgi:hypothetical protein